MTITPKFRLVLECCRSAFAGADSASRPDLGADVDWPAFLRLAQFHRVQGLVWRGLEPIGNALPTQVAEELSRDAELIAVANLRAAVESRDLLANFQRAGVSLLFVKGLTVAVLAYGEFAVKSGVDIDVLVSEHQLRDAATLLRNRGYNLVIPAVEDSVDRLDAWHRLHKESVWARDKIQIDLHTRLADNPRLIPSVGIASPEQLVNVSNGIDLPTLAPDELFAYLTVHGASSAWFRLKWITDFAALLTGRPSTEIERLYRRSQELGAGRAAAQALLLADELYHTLDNAPDLKRELGIDGASRWLAEVALRQVAGNENPVEPTSVAGGTAAIHYTQFLLLPGFRFKASELLRQVRYRLA